ncbi:MAG: rod shape-determining protein MreC [Acidobacteriota bacterium]
MLGGARHRPRARRHQPLAQGVPALSARWQNAVVALLLLGHLALLSNHPRTGGGPLERLFLGAVSPTANAASNLVQQVGGTADNLRLASSLRSENEALRTQVEEMRRELVRLYGVEEELQRLSRLSSYKPAVTGSSFVADVVFIDSESWLRTMIIHTGGERAQVNQVVVNEVGLIGRIVAVSGGYAKVLLATDRAAAASAMIQRTRRQALVRGAGAGLLSLENLPARSDVRKGDRVLTAGLDGVYPRGLKVGVVTEIDDGDGLFRRVLIEPAVDFGLLDQVNVLSQEPLPAQVRRDLLDTDGDAAP